MKKRKRTLWEWICVSGIIQTSTVFILSIIGETLLYNTMNHTKLSLHNLSDYKIAYIVTIAFWLIVLGKNALWLNSSRKIGLMTWLDRYVYDPPDVSGRKYKAQHPPVDEKYLSDKPDGLVLGKQGKKYVRFPISKGHALSSIILGTPGSGKSVLLLSLLVYQLNKANPKDESPKGRDRPTYFIIDVKPELLKKSTYPSDKYVKELSVTNRSKYGWDVYYNLGKCVTDDEILTELDVIARALIEEPKGSKGKNEFFYESARTIFKFLCLAKYKSGWTFMMTIDYILESDMEQVVMDVLAEAEDNIELLKVKRGLIAYENKEGSEAYSGIELAFRQSMEVFQKDSTRYFLESNPKKLSPLTLEDMITIGFTIKTTQIKEYKTILRLVVMQLLQHCENRDEDNSHLITLIIDEAYRLGVINWVDFLSISRSKQVSCVLAFQSLSQMQSVWSKEEADSLIEMVSAIAVLSCRSKTTAEMICSWAGDYQEEKISSNVGGKQDLTYSRTYDTKKVLEPVDLMQIQQNKEAILFLEGQYYRVDVDKARYYNIPELNSISKKCLEENEKQ